MEGIEIQRENKLQKQFKMDNPNITKKTTTFAESKMSDVKVIEGGLIDLGQEIEEGNIEFKLKLVDPSPERIQHLTSQLKWRLLEGQGEAFYEIGVEDNGFPRGLSDEELEKSIETLKIMAKNLNCEVFEVCVREGKEGKVAEMMVREVREDKYIDVRIAVCGNVDAGKSTFIGVLTKGKLDNGRGLARLEVFNHKHEIETGRTSSISHQILGFSASGKCVNYNDNLHSVTWGDIIEESYKVISFFDLAGHEKYFKTTVSGMTGEMPDYCFMIVGANMGVSKMTKEHFGIALSLRIPTIVIVTKIDIAPPDVLKRTLNDINNILKMRGVRKKAMIVNSEDDYLTAAKSILSDRVVPIFLVSNVTGKNLDYVRNFLNVLPPRIEWEKLKDLPPEIVINEDYHVNGVGTVVKGTVMAGTVKVGQVLQLGPDGNGKFQPVLIKSIHIKRVPVKTCSAGMSGGFALKKIKRSEIRKGMVLVSTDLNVKASRYFESEVIILSHSTTIQKNYQSIIQCLTISQPAKVVHINSKEVLRTGDKAKVVFKFLNRPEYLKEGMRIIFREGRCKGIGLVSRTCITEDEVLQMVNEK